MSSPFTLILRTPSASCDPVSNKIKLPNPVGLSCDASSKTIDSPLSVLRNPPFSPSTYSSWEPSSKSIASNGSGSNRR